MDLRFIENSNPVEIESKLSSKQVFGVGLISKNYHDEVKKV